MYCETLLQVELFRANAHLFPVTPDLTKPSF